MASTIITKYGSGAPLASDVVRGELAVDTENGRLYTEDSGGSVVEIGLNPSGNVDVTGTVTADGLTVDGSATIQASSSPALSVIDTTNNAEARLQAFNSTATVGTQSNHSFSIETNDTNRALFATNGDISFYEDTGTTAKFFWDASAESLGIGVSPSYNLDVYTTAAAYAAKIKNFNGTDAGGGLWIDTRWNTAGNRPLKITSNNEGTSILEVTGTGNVGIGTSSPASVLSVKSDVNNNVNNGILFEAADSTNKLLQLYENSVGECYMGFYQANVQTALIRTNGASYFNGGNVGIGETVPDTLLHLTGDNPKLTFEDNGAYVADSVTSSIVFTGKDSGGSNRGLAYIEAKQHAGANGTGSLDFRTRVAGVEASRLTIDSSGNVGIGCTPGYTFEVRTNDTSATPQQVIRQIGSGDAAIGFQIPSAANWYAGVDNSASDSFVIGRGLAVGTDVAITLDTSGNLLVGKSSNSANDVGGILRPDGQILGTVDDDYVAVFTRNTGDGEIIRIRKDTTTVGSIGVYNDGATAPYFADGGDVGIRFSQAGVDDIVPCDSTGADRDNGINWGSAGSRWGTIFAATGTINTSDANEKQDIAELDEAEHRVAVACKGLLRKFRWKDAVEAKGDEARIHFGIIAQDLQAAFEAEGLDAGRYAMFCSDTWTDEETGEERTRLGVRHDQLLAFIIAAI